MHRFGLGIGTCFLVILMTGCGTSGTLLDAQKAYRIGNVHNAGLTIDQFVQKKGTSRDRVIAYLEQGSIRRAANNIQGSLDSLTTADGFISEFDEKAKVSVSSEAAAMFTNLNKLPYRGYHYDRIMMNTYKGLALLELGRSDEARVEFRRAYERQKEAVQANAKKIEKAEKQAQEAADKKDGYDANKAQEDPKFKASVNQQYGDLDKFKAYGDYVNPFAEFMQGIYYLTAGQDGSDRETGRVSIKRVTGMVPSNKYLAQDLAMAEEIAASGQVPAVTYVIFETGTAPHRTQIRIDIPLFLVGAGVDYVGASFPKLKFNPSYAQSLAVKAGSETYQTEVLADMDAVIAREFKNDLPWVITRTLIASGAKAAAAYGAKQAAKSSGNQWVELATRVSTTVYQVAQNEADRRTWATLPKHVQYARMLTPESGTIEVSVSGQTRQVNLEPGKVNVVLVKSITPTSPLGVSQFTLSR